MLTGVFECETELVEQPHVSRHHLNDGVDECGLLSVGACQQVGVRVGLVLKQLQQHAAGKTPI